MEQRKLKEAFVSNLTGTSLEEVALGTFLAPLCLINRGLVLILYHRTQGTLPLPWPSITHLLLDFCTIVLPLVLSCTILSDVLLQVILGLALVSAGALFPIYRSGKAFFQGEVQSDKQVPCVTIFRVLVNVKTAISILAVDFSIFPRRYAKTETYGTGVMDFGVGAYVFANALVCPEAKRKGGSGSNIDHVTKQLLSVWPLVVLGMVRFVSVKMTGYHEHITEYGVHWNFFFTLAIVRVAASMLLAMFPVNRSWLLALLIASLYQFVLETTGLKSFMSHNDERTRNFLYANKEGIFSVFGYIAIYMAGVQVGLYVMQPRTGVRDWARVMGKLLLGSCVLYSALYTCRATLEPVSRRMANLPFCLWTVAQSLFFLASLGMADLVLVFCKRVSGCNGVSSSWDPSKKEDESFPDKKRSQMEGLCLIQAVSRNQLLFFMLANMMTGLTNVLVNTVSSSDAFSMFVLISYMFMNCCVIYVLHLCGVTVKFW